MAGHLALGIDTSNYATSMALLDIAANTLLWAEKRFLPVKPGELGLRQNDTLFHHTVALPQLLQALAARQDLSGVAIVGVSERPRPVNGSYMPCFLAGVSFGSAFAAAAGVSLVKTSHQEGHLAAALAELDRPQFMGRPYLFMHVSGGTTEWWLAQGAAPLQRLGGSLDLNAGQLLDRLGVELGHAFPAGAAVTDLALGCTEDVPPKTSVKGLDCNLSGLQNQYGKMLQSGRDAGAVAKFCLLSLAHSFLAVIAVVRRQYPGIPVVCAGGVMCSTVIRDIMCAEETDLYFVSPQYSSDNAIGVAWLAGEALHG
ncbi:MAG: glycoprotease [Ruminococcaceae bacterium]|nr:glycoprotease [Oscillospiraceae bacterium]